MPPLFGARARSVSVARRRLPPRILSLSSLPDELILHILDHIHPSDLLSFSHTNSHIYACSLRHLAKHRRLQTQYSKAVISWDSTSWWRGDRVLDDDEVDESFYCRHPIFLLEEIYTEPTVAHYVRSVEVHGIDIVGGQKRKDLEIQDEITSSVGRCDGARDILLATRNFEDRQGEWKEIKDGSRPAAFNLLIECLPHVERLRFVDVVWFDHDLMPGLYEVLKRAPQLSTIEVRPSYSDPDCMDMYDLAVFALLPTVRHLKGKNISGPEDEDESMFKTWESHESNVESIEISNGDVEPAAIARVLKIMPKLKVFRYSFARPSSTIGDIVDVLRDGAGRTLEIISLTSYGRETHGALSFRSFEKLRELEIHMISLLRPITCGQTARPPGLSSEVEELAITDAANEDHVPRLIDVLPPLLERLTLKIDRHAEDCKQLFDGFKEHHREALPNLSLVELVSSALSGSPPVDNLDSLLDIREYLAIAGIDVKCHHMACLIREQSWMSHPCWKCHRYEIFQRRVGRS